MIHTVEHATVEGNQGHHSLSRGAYGEYDQQYSPQSVDLDTSETRSSPHSVNSEPNNRRVTYNWRAYSLRWPYLSFLITLSVIFLSVLETVRQLSNRRQGLAHFLDPEDISSGVSFAQNYLPTFIGVLYSLLWSFVDSDVKRLEPYYQMKSPGTPANVLLLDYSFCSPFTIPIRAIRAKHWILSAVSIVYLLLSLILPASMGSLLSLSEISVVHQSESFETLGNIHEAHEFFQGDFLNQLQSILVSNGTDLPPWTTFEYSVEPFQPLEHESGRNDTWTAETTVAFAEPNCLRFELSNVNFTRECCYSLPPSDSPTEPRFLYRLGVTADARLPSGEGPPCEMSLSYVIIASVDGYPGMTVSSFWVPQNTNIYNDLSQFMSLELSNIGSAKQFDALPPGFYFDIAEFKDFESGYKKNIESSCPHNPRITGIITEDYGQGLDEELISLNIPSSDVLALNSSNSDLAEQIINIIETISVDTAWVVCSPQYFSSNAEVTVNGRDATIQNVRPLGVRKQLDSQEFNQSNFESILDYGVIGDLFKLLQVHTTDSVNPEAPPFLVPHNISHLDPLRPGPWAVDSLQSMNFLSIAYGYNLNSSITEDGMSSLDEYTRSMNAIYRLAFAASFSNMLPSDSPSRPLEGKRSQEVITIVVTPPFAIVAESLLGLATVTLVVIMLTYSRRQNILQSDPDSLSAQLSLISDVMKDMGPLESRDASLDRSNTRSIMNILETLQVDYNDDEESISILTGRNSKLGEKFQGPKPIKTQPAMWKGFKNGRSETKSRNLNADFPDPLPLLLTKLGILATILYLASILFALFFLRFWVSHINGFLFQGEFRAFRSQLLWSFLPTLLSTVIEASSLTVHRDLSILESWVRLKESTAKATRSLSLPYASRPPVLVFFLSLRRKHYLLSLISFCCITTSILNIAMAGLFVQSFLDISTERTVNSMFTNTTFRYLNDDSTEMPLDYAWSMIYNNITRSSDLLSWQNQEFSFIPVQIQDIDTSDSRPITFNSTTPGFGGSLYCEDFPTNDKVKSEGLGLWTETTLQPNSTIRGRARFNPTVPSSNSSLACETVFILQDNIPSMQFQLSTEVEKSSSGLNDPLSDSQVPDALSVEQSDLCMDQMVLTHTNTETREVSVYLCRTKIEVQMFNVLHDTEGTILAATGQLEKESSVQDDFLGLEDIASWYQSNWLWECSINYRKTVMSAYDWPGLLITRLRSMDGNMSIQDAANKIYARSFATWFSINRNALLEPRNPADRSVSARTGIETHQEPRVILSVPAVGVCMSLICMYLAVYIFIIFRRRHRYTGPRMPKTIGSLIPWVIHSRMLHDFKGLNSLKSKDRNRELDSLNNSYGFGRFRSMDGKVRLGIEYEEVLMARGAYGDF